MHRRISAAVLTQVQAALIPAVQSAVEEEIKAVLERLEASGEQEEEEEEEVSVKRRKVGVAMPATVAEEEEEVEEDDEDEVMGSDDLAGVVDLEKEEQQRRQEEENQEVDEDGDHVMRNGGDKPAVAESPDLGAKSRRRGKARVVVLDEVSEVNETRPSSQRALLESQVDEAGVLDLLLGTGTMDADPAEPEKPEVEEEEDPELRYPTQERHMLSQPAQAMSDYSVSASRNSSVGAGAEVVPIPSQSQSQGQSQSQDDQIVSSQYKRLAGKGAKAMEEGDYEEAVRALTLVLEDPEASAKQKINQRYNRSMAYFKLKKFDLALADADAVIARDPNWYKALEVRTRSLVRLGRYDEALPVGYRTIEAIEALQKRIESGKASKTERSLDRTHSDLSVRISKAHRLVRIIKRSKATREKKLAQQAKLEAQRAKKKRQQQEEEVKRRQTEEEVRRSSKQPANKHVSFQLDALAGPPRRALQPTRAPVSTSLNSWLDQHCENAAAAKWLCLHKRVDLSVVRLGLQREGRVYSAESKSEFVRAKIVLGSDQMSIHSSSCDCSSTHDVCVHACALAYCVAEEQVARKLHTHSLQDLKAQARAKGVVQTGSAVDVSRALARAKVFGVFKPCPRCRRPRMIVESGKRPGRLHCKGIFDKHNKCTWTSEDDVTLRTPWTDE